MKDYYWTLRVQGRKYDPNQPRVPAGNPDGGRWTAGASNLGEVASSSDPINTSNLGGGVMDAQLIEYENGTRAVWKPMYAIDPETGQRRVGHDGGSEIAVYRIAELLGYGGLVPETVIEQGTVPRGTSRGKIYPARENVDGTAQLFIENAQTGFDKGWQQEMDLAQKNMEQIEGMLVLDLIAGNKDRHRANYVYDENDQIHAIDHGQSFWDRRNPYRCQEVSGELADRFLFKMEMFGDPPRDYQISPERIAKWRTVTRAEFLKTFVDLDWSGNLNPRNAWDNFQDILATNGELRW